MNWADFDRTIEEFDRTGDWKPPNWMGEAAPQRAAPSVESHLIPELPVEQWTGPPFRRQEHYPQPETLAVGSLAGLSSRAVTQDGDEAVPHYRGSRYASAVLGAKRFL